MSVTAENVEILAAVAPAAEAPTPEEKPAEGRDDKGRFLPKDDAKPAGDAKKPAADAKAAKDAKGEAPKGDDAEKPATEPAKPELLAPKFAALAKKERETQANAAALKADRERFAAEREALTRDRAEIEALKAEIASAKKNPLKWLERAGLTLDEVATAILNADKPESPEAKRDRELAEIRAELDAAKKAEKEREERQRAEGGKQLVERIQREIDTTLGADTDRFEMLNIDPHGRDRVLTAMNWVYVNGDPDNGFAKGVIPPVEKVADLVENMLVADAREKLAKAKKLQPTIAAPAVPPAKADEAKTEDSGAQAKKAAPTLSNRTATSPASPKTNNESYLDEKEADKRALALLRWKSTGAPAR